MQEKEITAHLKACIDEAVEQEWIEVYYQPIVCTDTGKVCALEALARWNDPKYGCLAPAHFLDTLEESELICKLDVYMMEKICRLFVQIVEDGGEVIPVSLNLTHADFVRTDIFQAVEDARKRYHIPVSYLQLEITERVYQGSNDRIDAVLNRFRETGYALWLDDFGTGFSTVDLLKDHSFDVLKIDKSFLQCGTERSRRIIQSIVSMDDLLNMRTVCEGVETAEEFEFLKVIGCRMAQGYYFGKPLPYKQCIENCRKKNLLMEKRA